MAIQRSLQMLKALHHHIYLIDSLAVRTTKFKWLVELFGLEVAYKICNLAQRNSQIVLHDPCDHEAHQHRKNQISGNHVFLRLPQQIAVVGTICPYLNRS